MQGRICVCGLMVHSRRCTLPFVNLNTVLPSGKAQCPFHSHRGEEEMFLILEGGSVRRIHPGPRLRGDRDEP